MPPPSLTQMQHSNSLISTNLPAGLVAVFVGGTNGVGEKTLIQFARLARSPVVYFIGRSLEAGARIKAECEALSPTGSFTFISTDVSLMSNVDEACERINKEVEHVNVLVMSCGTMRSGDKTSEGLHFASALLLHTRIRFAQQLLPRIRAAPSLKRVLSIFCAHREGALFRANIEAWNVPIWKGLGHAASLVTLSLERLALDAPDVGFVHSFPGVVDGGILRGAEGWVFSLMRVKQRLDRWRGGAFMDAREAGERQVFFATSARYMAREGGVESLGVVDDGGVARGSDGQLGSGVYSVDENANEPPEKVLAALKEERDEGGDKMMWEYVMGDFERICGDSS